MLKKLPLFLKISFLIIISSILLQCSPAYDYNRVITVLVDFSGSYKSHIDQAFDDIKSIVNQLDRGDVFYLGVINSSSFDDQNIKIYVVMANSISKVRKQKEKLVKQIDSIKIQFRPSNYTDIQGALIMISDNMNKINARLKKVFLFTDLKETRKITGDYNLSGVEVYFLDIPLGKDPGDYKKRLTHWRELLIKHQVKKVQFFSPSQSKIELSKLIR